MTPPFGLSWWAVGVVSVPVTGAALAAAVMIILQIPPDTPRSAAMYCLFIGGASSAGAIVGVAIGAGVSVLLGLESGKIGDPLKPADQLMFGSMFAGVVSSWFVLVYVYIKERREANSRTEVTA